MVGVKEVVTGLAMIGAAAMLPSTANAQTQDRAEETAADSILAATTLTLTVDGMSCPFCAYGLEKKLKELEAVDTLVVRISDGLVAIRTRQGQDVPDSVLYELVTRAGFSLREVVRLKKP